MPHLSELHGAATHLAVLAVPLLALLVLLRRVGRGGPLAAQLLPWALGAGIVGVVATGVTGLLVWGQAQTMLRGSSFRLGTAHFWLGIGIAAVVLVLSVGLLRGGSAGRFAGTHRRRPELVAAAVLALVAIPVQGYLGGRMTYEHGVGVDRGGQLAQSASGAAQLEAAFAKGMDEAAAGRQAFSAEGLGCARCHGALAQGERGPSLQGGRELEEFRRVHGQGLFPERIVTDRDFAAINAYLRSLGPGRPQS